MKQPDPDVGAPRDADTARSQLRKAAAYFGGVLEAHEAFQIGAVLDEVTIVVARGVSGRRLAEYVKREGILERLEEPIEIELRVHEPGPDSPRGAKGNVHIHTVSAFVRGRLSRRAGECLCQKRHGSNERSVYEVGSATICRGCEEAAARLGIRIQPAAA